MNNDTGGFPVSQKYNPEKMRGVILPSPDFVLILPMEQLYNNQ